MIRNLVAEPEVGGGSFCELSHPQRLWEICYYVLPDILPQSALEFHDLKLVSL